jgi:Rrf2 family protein
MQLSAKAEYACLAMVELAMRHERGLPTSLKEIARQLGLSHAFLMQIFMVLKGARLVKGLRGPGGGFTLSRSPEVLSLLDIVEAIDGPGDETAMDSLRQAPLVRSLKFVGRQARHAAREVFRSAKLGDLARQAQELGALEYQI